MLADQYLLLVLRDSASNLLLFASESEYLRNRLVNSQRALCKSCMLLKFIVLYSVSAKQKDPSSNAMISRDNFLPTAFLVLSEVLLSEDDMLDDDVSDKKQNKMKISFRVSSFVHSYIILY